MSDELPCIILIARQMGQFKRISVKIQIKNDATELNLKIYQQNLVSFR